MPPTPPHPASTRTPDLSLALRSGLAVSPLSQLDRGPFGNRSAGGRIKGDVDRASNPSQRPWRRGWVLRCAMGHGVQNPATPRVGHDRHLLGVRAPASRRASAQLVSQPYPIHRVVLETLSPSAAGVGVRGDELGRVCSWSCGRRSACSSGIGASGSVTVTPTTYGLASAGRSRI